VARPLLVILFRLSLCFGVLYLLWPTWGPFAILIPFAPLAAISLARPVQDLVEEIGLAGKEHALADLQGKYWAHRGYRLDIEEDGERQRWLLTADVRKIVTGLARDEVLQRQFGDRAGVLDDAPGFRLRGDALAEYLAKATDMPSLKFRNWLDHEVLGGSKNPRAARAPQSNSSV
jgi:hypothetical protein